jgi:transcriptional regulator with XRE-family HTH domain
MITAARLGAGCVLVGIGQRQLAELSGLSVPTIQQMEASETVVRGNAVSLANLISVFHVAVIEMVDEGAAGPPPRRGARQKINSGSAETCLHNQAENRAAFGKRVGT